MQRGPVLVEQVQRLEEAFKSDGVDAAAVARVQPAPAHPLQVRASLRGSVGFNGFVFGGLRLCTAAGGRSYASFFGSVVVLTDIASGRQTHLFDPAPSRPSSLAPLAPHSNPLCCLAVCSSGKLVAVGGSGVASDVVVWDVSVEPAVVAHRLQQHTHGLRALDFSQDDRFLLTLGNDADRKLFIYDLQSPSGGGSGTKAALVAHFTFDSITRVRFGPRIKDARSGSLTPAYQIATACADRLEFLEFNAVKGSITPQGRVALGSQKRSFHTLDWHPDGLTLFAGSASGDVLIVLASTRVLIQTIAPSGQAASAVGSVSFLSNGRVMVGRKEGTFTTYERKGAAAAAASASSAAASSATATPFLDVAQFRLPKGYCSITSCALDASSGRAIVGTEESSIYCIPDVLAKDPQVKRLSQAHVAAVTDVCWSVDPKQQIFATSSADGSVNLFDGNSLQQITQGGTQLLPSAAFAPAAVATCVVLAANLIIAGYASGALRGFSLTGAEVWSLPQAHKGAVSALALGRTGRYVTSAGSHGEVRAWNLQSRALLSDTLIHSTAVMGLAAYADGQRVLSVAHDRRLVETDLRAGKLRSLHESSGSIVALALSPDERLIVTLGTENALCFWDLLKTLPVHTVPSAHGAGAEPTCLCISANGLMMASGDAQGRIVLWNTGLKTVHATLTQAHTAPVRKLQFSRDDRQLISVGDDGAILQWQLDGW